MARCASGLHQTIGTEAICPGQKPIRPEPAERSRVHCLAPPEDLQASNGKKTAPFWIAPARTTLQVAADCFWGSISRGRRINDFTAAGPERTSPEPVRQPAGARGRDRYDSEQ